MFFYMLRLFVAALAVMGMMVAPSVSAVVDGPVPGTGEAAITAVEVEEESATNRYEFTDALITDGVILGDLFGLAETITIANAIGADLFGLSQVLNINAPVAGDVRSAAETIIISENVDGELLAAAATVQVLESVTIGDDTKIAVESAVLDGTFAGDVLVYAADVVLGGTFEGNVEIEAASFTIEEGATFAGDLTYKVPTEAVSIAAGVVLPENTVVEAYQPKGENKDYKKAFGVFAVLKFVAMLVFAMLLFAVLPTWTSGASEEGVETFGSFILTGFLAGIFVPLIGILILATIIGFPLGVMVLLLHTGIWITGTVLGAIFLGSLVFKLVKKESSATATWGSVILGVVLMFIVGLIPVLGWITAWVFTFAGMGLLYRRVYARYKNARGAE